MTIKIKIPTGSKQSGKYVPVVIVDIDEEGNEVAETEVYAIMGPDGSIGCERFQTLEGAQDECDLRNSPKPETK